MLEANCLEESPAAIVTRVLKGKKPVLVSARKGEQGVLVPYGKYEALVASHPRVIDALMKDLKKPGTDMAQYCRQIGATREQDAFRYLDGNEKPVLALVGAKRFQKWSGAKKKG
ncbi:MAG TPA: hypothetical protein VND93_28930 [Myxococcales bacterium]|jgi:hypothetical protein|nr:hypothetical protein [Myxococcales bacterium]